MRPQREDTRIAELQKDMQVRAPAYERAVSTLSAKDEKWTLERHALERRIVDIGLRFQPDDPATKAVYLMGQLEPLLKELLGPHNIIATHESDKQKLIELREKQQSRRSAEAEAT